MFGKKKNLIKCFEIIYPAMTDNISIYGNSISEQLAYCGEDVTEEQMVKVNNIATHRYREKILEDVKDVLPDDVMPSFENRLKKYAEMEGGQEMVDEMGYSPAMIGLALYYALTGKPLDYGEMRPLNVEEQQLKDEKVLELFA